MADTKKRLPVLKQTPEEEQGEEPRPAWHWVGFGACVIIGAWLPLSIVSQLFTMKLIGAELGADLSTFKDDEVWAYVAQRVAEAPDLGGRILLISTLLAFPPFFIGAFVGGFVVGRWGGDNAGTKQAAAAGVAASLVILVLVWTRLGGGNWWVAIVLVAIAAGMGALGGKVGFKRRIKARTPNIR